ncbi:MAG: hypothetical protein VX335_03695 [Pseudomonadota bacterium]|nr:hypothetical protein [Pseudomonadota bacterium]
MQPYKRKNFFGDSTDNELSSQSSFNTESKKSKLNQSPESERDDSISPVSICSMSSLSSSRSEQDFENKMDNRDSSPSVKDSSGDSSELTEENKQLFMDLILEDGITKGDRLLNTAVSIIQNINPLFYFNKFPREVASTKYDVTTKMLDCLFMKDIRDGFSIDFNEDIQKLSGDLNYQVFNSSSLSSEDLKASFNNDNTDINLFSKNEIDEISEEFKSVLLKI